MTAQIGDRLEFRGQQHTLHTEPLEMLFAQDTPRPDLPPLSTACWRGYIAHWRIQQNKLELLHMQMDMGYTPPASSPPSRGALILGRRSAPASASPGGSPLALIFPDLEPPIEATWYTGILQIPLGECVQYVHLDYASTYERYRYLHIFRGQLIYHELRTSHDWNRLECELLDRPEGLSCDEEWAFFRSMCDARDYAPHLLYADWLDEQQQAELAQTVRRIVALQHQHQPDQEQSEWIAQLAKLRQSIDAPLVSALVMGPLIQQTNQATNDTQPEPRT
jgi:uncharacterized protein (TIGR02996 family)